MQHASSQIPVSYSANQRPSHWTTTFHGGSEALHAFCVQRKPLGAPRLTSVSLRDSEHRIPLANDMVPVLVMFQIYSFHCSRTITSAICSLLRFRV